MTARAKNGFRATQKRLLALLTVESWCNPCFKIDFARSPKRALRKLLAHSNSKVSVGSALRLIGKKNALKAMDADNPVGTPLSEAGRQRYENEKSEQPTVRIQLSPRQKSLIGRIAGGEIEVAILELMLEERGSGRLTHKAFRAVEAVPFGDHLHRF